jgi:hypothetical protein
MIDHGILVDTPPPQPLFGLAPLALRAKGEHCIVSRDGNGVWAETE